MRRFLLDTSAFLTLRDDEPGADRVAGLLRASDAHCIACFMTRMELLYRVWKDEDELAGKLALEQSMALPVEWIEASEKLLLRAAEIKAKHSLSVADAWIAAAALEHNAVLVHKDPEFEQLALDQETLTYKTGA
jgi:ribonuclease VapC